MIDITINVATDLLISIPESSSGDTVTYEIFDSDGTVLDSGNLTFVRDEIWKVSSFTPSDFGTITLKANDSTLSSKREEFYRVVGDEIASQSGDWGADLVLGTNTWTTGDEAEAYFANRFGASDFWDALTDAQKKSAMITAYNQLKNCSNYSFPSAVADITQKMKNAQCEQALFIVIHAADALRRRGLQAQGVSSAGIVKETYKDGAGKGIIIAPDADVFLTDYDALQGGFFVADLERDEDLDAGASV